MTARGGPVAVAQGVAAVLREALAAARSQPVASLLTIAVVAGMCGAALLTTGRTVAAEQAALAQIDAVGTRSVVVQADPSSGLTVALLDRLRDIEAIEAVTGFGPITDARNAAVPGASKVAVRPGYGNIAGRSLAAAEASAADTTEQRALASEAAIEALGLRDGTGQLLSDDGRSVIVVGELTVPAHLAFLEPLVLIPSSTDGAAAGADPDAPLVVLVVLARTPQDVAVVETTVRSLLNPVDPTRVTIETSAQLAAVRAAVRGELGSYGRSTVLAILAVASLLVAANLLGLVTMRRRDFGRRRALGASQALIVALLLAQVVVLAVIGAILGAGAALIALAAADQPIPDGAFTVAVAIAAVLTAAVAAFLPAVVASRRDPLHELRVP